MNRPGFRPFGPSSPIEEIDQEFRMFGAAGNQASLGRTAQNIPFHKQAVGALQVCRFDGFVERVFVFGLIHTVGRGRPGTSPV